MVSASPYLNQQSLADSAIQGDVLSNGLYHNSGLENKVGNSSYINRVFGNVKQGVALGGLALLLGIAVACGSPATATPRPTYTPVPTPTMAPTSTPKPTRPPTLIPTATPDTGTTSYPDCNLTFLGEGVSKGVYTSQSKDPDITGHEIILEGSKGFSELFQKVLKFSEDFPDTHRHINIWTDYIIEHDNPWAATNNHKVRMACMDPEFLDEEIRDKDNYLEDKETMMYLTAILAHEAEWIMYQLQTRHLTMKEGYIRVLKKEIEAYTEMGADESWIEFLEDEIVRCGKGKISLCE
jgi:hypothetical protein